MIEYAAPILTPLATVVLLGAGKALWNKITREFAEGRHQQDQRHQENIKRLEKIELLASSTNGRVTRLERQTAWIAGRMNVTIDQLNLIGNQPEE